MPFIWDDFEWKWVDDQEQYDKSRFVIARKLHVKLKTDPRRTSAIQEFSVDSIRQHIEHFGAIESIEILPDKDKEAHLTFASDRSAYLMQSQYDADKKARRKQPFKVEPANTWEQPRDNTSPPSEGDVEQTSEIFMLNETCLLHLFKLLDVGSLVEMADVCKLFNRLLHQQCFPNLRKFDVTDDTDPAFTLAKLRRIMLCIGPFITDLSYGVNSEKELDEDDEYFERTLKCLDLIAQHVGQNLRRACFAFKLNRQSIATVTPILYHLESLEIADEEQVSGDDIDFHALCPNLIEFKVNMDMPMIACCKPWPSLRSLSVTNNGELERTTLASFVQQNRQLTCLEFTLDERENCVYLTMLHKYLPRLEKLSIVNFVKATTFARSFEQLKKLRHLQEINLETTHKHLDVIIQHLEMLTKLRNIRLSCNNGYPKIRKYEQSLVTLAKNLPLLERLTIDSIAIKKESLVDIICSARQLKTLCVLHCKLVFCDELIDEVVDALKVSRPESDGALQLYVDKKNLNKLDAGKFKAFGRYLQLKFAEEASSNQ